MTDPSPEDQEVPPQLERPPEHRPHKAVLERVAEQPDRVTPVVHVASFVRP